MEKRSVCLGVKEGDVFLVNNLWGDKYKIENDILLTGFHYFDFSLYNHLFQDITNEDKERVLIKDLLNYL